MPLPKKTKSARLSKLAQRLLEAEADRTGRSEGEIIEECLYAQIQTPEAVAIMREEVEKDPSLKALFARLSQVANDAQVEYRLGKKPPRER